jgi:hypothetical protein
VQLLLDKGRAEAPEGAPTADETAGARVGWL